MGVSKKNKSYSLIYPGLRTERVRLFKLIGEAFRNADKKGSDLMT